MTVQQTLPRPTPPQPIPAPPPPPSPVPRSRSVLGRVVVFASSFAVGVLGMIDLAGVRVSGSAYLALVLSVIGAGLLVGAWYGRARWLIAAGAGVAMLLGSVSLAESAGPAGSTTWRPTSIEQIGQDYVANVGNAVLDLSAVNFAGQTRTMVVQVNVGDLQIVLPSDVDVVVEANVTTGNAHVLGTAWGGLGQPPRTVTDSGADGTGGGQLTLRATVKVGNLEVRR